MKMFVYSLREYDEREFFDRFCEKYGIEYESTGETPVPDNVYMAEGFDVINIITSPISAEHIDRLKEAGVKCIATRTIGYDHIDYEYARKVGIGVINISYSPATVADYTIMMMLMGLRRIKHIMQRSAVQDFSLKGKIGRELRQCIVGVVGTGRIGRCVIDELQGFGCRILAYDPGADREDFAKANARCLEYTDLETLLRTSDIITLHAPGTKDNYHLLGEEQFSIMKNSVGIVNCARGMLVDSDALIRNVENGKVGFACLDTIEDEFGIYYFDRTGEPLSNHSLAILNSFTNVIVTSHMAFYTDEAVSNMVENSVKGAVEYLKEHV